MAGRDGGISLLADRVFAANSHWKCTDLPGMACRCCPS